MKAAEGVDVARAANDHGDVERYRGVHGGRRVERIRQALKASGATILEDADPTVAPFEFRVCTAQGQVVDLICYAFTANEYRQDGRPEGEHRFQVKFGSDFKRAHHLYLDASRTRVTLFFGVHDELDLFIAADPTMHTPTWFSVSVEFPEHELTQALETGWHGWERERSHVRRRIALPDEDLRTEVLVAFKPERFIQYVEFERACSGADPGERLLVSDRLEARSGGLAQASTSLLGHPLETQLGLSATEILDVLGAHFRLLAAVRGSVAEHHLGLHLRTVPGVRDVQHVDEDGAPDFRLLYCDRPLRIECKNVLRRSVDGNPRVDFQKTRVSKNDPCSRYYSPDQFEVLAACLHPVTERWEFRFSFTATLDPHRKCAGRLSERVIVSGDRWRPSLPDLLAGASP